MRTFAAIDFLKEMIDGKEFTVLDLDKLDGQIKWELLEDGLIFADPNNSFSTISITMRGRNEYDHYSKLERNPPYMNPDVCRSF